MKQWHAAVRTLLAVLAFFVLAATPTFAQTVTGGLQGTVKDATGAVVAGAEVKAKNTATGAEANTTTNAEGLYRFPSLNPGSYNVTVSAQGFKKSEITAVTVNVGAAASVEVSLQPGGGDEIVEVSAGEATIERETAQISNNFSNKQVTNLPINTAAGGVDTIALLTPGVVGGVAGGFGNTNGTTIFSNGGRSRSNNFNIDGQDNNDLTVTGPATFVNNPDTVQEFQIITNGFSAEFGQAGGSVVNILTKSGQNNFFGTAAFYYRNRKIFDTLTNLERRIGRPEAPPQINRTFSFTGGGPIIKNKLLFFGSYQGQRQPGSTLAQSGPNGLTPTPTGIQTLLSTPGLDPAIANLIRRAAPFNVQLGNTEIQPGIATRLVPVTIGNTTRQIEFGAIQRTVSTPFTENQATTRIDYNINEKMRLFGTYQYQKLVNTFATGSFTNGFIGDVPSKSNRFGSSFIYTISPRAVNEFRFSYGRISVTFGGGNLQEATAADQDVANIVFPAGFLGWGPATNLPQGRINDNYQYYDIFSYTLGRHQLKAGVDIRRRLSDLIFLPTVNGQFFFTTTGANLNQFATNAPNQVNLAFGNTATNLKDTQQYYFFQDDWKIKDNLTLNLGIRYENFGQPINLLNDLTRERESNPQTAFFNPSIPVESRIVPRVPVDRNNFSPRLGFAYSPNFGGDNFIGRYLKSNPTVIRGGFGLAYDLAFYNILLNMSTATPVVFLTSVAGGPNVRVPSDPTGTGVRSALASLAPLRTADPRTLNRTTVASDFRSPYTMQFSLGIQTQFKRNTTIEVGYVGNRALQQFQTINANPQIAALARDFPNLIPAGIRPVAQDNPVAVSRGRILPGEGLIRDRVNGARSYYDSLQIQITHRWKDFLSINNFTIAKQIDTGTDIFNTGVGVTIPQDPFDPIRNERARGFLDFRYNYSMSFIYSLPFYRNQEGILGHMLGGWQVAGTYRALPGQPYTAQQFNFGSQYNDAAWANAFLGQPDGGLRPFAGSSSAPANTVALDDVTARARFGAVVGTSSSPTGYFLLNDLAQGRATPVTANQVRFIVNTNETARRFGTPYGNVGRNTLVGDDTRIGNFSVFKDTKISRSFSSDRPLTLQFRFEMFNVFNTQNLGVPNGNIDNAGGPSSVFANTQENNGGRRTIQFGLRLLF